MDSFERKEKYFRDPFGVDPPAKAYYYPSPPRNLNKEARKTALSRDRTLQQSQKPNQEALDEDSKRFLQASRTYSNSALLTQQADVSKFDESWLSSERPSSVSLTVAEDASPAEVDKVCSRSFLNRFENLKKTLEFGDVDRKNLTTKRDPNTVFSKPIEQGSSTLQRYINRFRNAKPQSRDERKIKSPGSKDFWWLSSSHSPKFNSSGPGDLERGRRKTHSEANSPSVLSDITDVTDNTGTKHLLENKEISSIQERTDRLLERSSSSLASSCPVVSSEGLGSSTSDISSFEEVARRPLVASRYAEQNNGAKFFVPRSENPLPFPENDILYQWRLKRKMEQARATPVLSKGVNKPSASMTMGHPINFEGLYNIVHDVKVPYHPDGASQIKKTPPIASPTLEKEAGTKNSPETHLHLMCDLLPCPHQAAYRDKYSKKDSADKSTSFSEKEQTLYKQYLEAERPDVEKHIEESEPTQNENGFQKKVENKLVNEKPLPKPDPVHVRNDNPKEKMDSEENRSRAKTKGTAHGENAVVEPLYSSSPKVHGGRTTLMENAIGQVVRDRMFNTSSSSVISSVDSLASFSSPQPPLPVNLKEQQTTSLVTPSHPVQPETTALQLEVNEGEEYISDGEFEEDKLLQLLRHQRTQFEQQLREIDEQLAQEITDVHS